MPKLDSKRDVVVVQYDAGWPQEFASEKARIEAALGGIVIAIEHAGSTAVPGLAAKPIIDMVAGVRQLADCERCVAPLEALGYEDRGGGGMPDHRFFRKGQPRTHHLHMVEHESAFWREHIAFRDLLRASPDLALRYGALKQRLAIEFRTQREAYTEAKTPFITAALGRTDGLSDRGRLAQQKSGARG